MADNKIGKSLGWKLLERFGVQGSQFILQLVLARILAPEHYGVLSLMVIFTNLATVFIQNGFNTALIQDKDVTEEDYSSVFWVSFGIAGILYGAIFFCAPLIARFYNMPDIIWPLRILALMLLPGALNSVQLAKVSREMNFKKVFISNLGGILVAGAAGIAVALLGGGLWALVTQTLLNVVVVCIIMTATVHLKFHFSINWKRIGVLFRFGWKLLVSGLINTTYGELRSLVIGKKYDSGTLGHYNRGKQFPQFIINAIDGAVQSVLLPAMSKEQNDPAKVKELTRNSITISSYIIFPLMAGLAGAAAPLVSLLLGAHWLPCVPYLQIYCFSLAFYPVHSCNLQAINATGRSDIFLKLEIFKKALGIACLCAAVFCFESPIAIAASGVVIGLVSSFINAFPNKKLIGYSYLEQVKDILPSMLCSFLMLGGILAVPLLGFGAFPTLLLQLVAGVAIYALLSLIFRLSPFLLLVKILKKVRTKDKE